MDNLKIKKNAEASELVSGWVVRIIALKLNMEYDQARLEFGQLKEFVDKIGRIVIDNDSLKEFENLEKAYEKEEKDIEERTKLPPFNIDELKELINNNPGNKKIVTEYIKTHTHTHANPVLPNQDEPVK